MVVEQGGAPGEKICLSDVTSSRVSKGMYQKKASARDADRPS
jgi:hypothetical protein